MTERNRSTEQTACAVICKSDSVKAREIAQKPELDRKTVNQVLYTPPLLIGFSM